MGCGCLSVVVDTDVDVQAGMCQATAKGGKSFLSLFFFFQVLVVEVASFHRQEICFTWKNKRKIKDISTIQAGFRDCHSMLGHVQNEYSCFLSTLCNTMSIRKI